MQRIPLSSVNFIKPIHLNRSTTHTIWNEESCINTKMYLYLGGTLRMVLFTVDPGSKEETPVRILPYHSILDFVPAGGDAWATVAPTDDQPVRAKKK